MKKQQMIDDIHALVANSEVSDAVAEKLLPIVYWLEAELEGENMSNRDELWRVIEFLTELDEKELAFQLRVLYDSLCRTEWK